MKRILLVMTALLAITTQIFAQEAEEENNKVNYVYQTNRPGDQYIKVGLMPLFPLNFEDQLYIGGAIQIGYHRFLTNWLAVGGDFTPSYNPTRGNNVFYVMPVTVGVTAVPLLWRLEFPLSLNVGMAFETVENKKYFPGLILSAEASAYYRVSESWSFGIGSTFTYMPQWYSEEESTMYEGKYGNYDYGLFITAAALARYHF